MDKTACCKEKRDIQQYGVDYNVPGFEEYQVLYRRKKVLEAIQEFAPCGARFMEIGCGMEPLFCYLDEAKYGQFTTIEPCDDFYDNALQLAKMNPKVTCVHGFLDAESVRHFQDEKKQFDMIICSSLLHELGDPDGMLKCIAQVCTEETVVHINVPNARSFHRIWAKYAGLIRDEHQMSERNVTFQQATVFDLNSLKELVIANGFEILDSGSFFMKPFSHKQMYQLVTSGMLNNELLDGLYKKTEEFPEFGSEIYVNCKLSCTEKRA